MLILRRRWLFGNPTETPRMTSFLWNIMKKLKTASKFRATQIVFRKVFWCNKLFENLFANLFLQESPEWRLISAGVVQIYERKCFCFCACTCLRWKVLLSIEKLWQIFLLGSFMPHKWADGTYAIIFHSCMGGCVAQRKHSCFPPSSPGFESQLCRDFFSPLLKL